MKTFAYTYRDHSGALGRASLQALDRSDALRQITAMNRVPVSVTEGSAMPSAAAGLKLPPRVLALAGAAGVLLALVAALRLMPKPTAHRKPAAVKSAQPAPKAAETVKMPKEAGKTTGVDTQQLAVTQQELLPSEAQPQALKKAGAAASPKALDAKNAEDEQARINDALNRPFKTGTEQLIAMLGLPGEEMPPIPLMADDTLEEDFAAALTNVIVVLDKDDDQSVARKENVAWIKQFIKEGQAMGWTPADYIRELEKKRKEEASLRRQAHQVMSDVESAEATDKGTAKAVREQLNKELTDQGILPLEAPEE